MKTNTILGTVTILGAQMMKTGTGSYKIVVSFEFENETKQATYKLNDSELWDNYTDREVDGFVFLKEHASWYMEEAVNGFVNSL